MPDLKPQTPAPTLEVETLAGEKWALADQAPDHFSMVVFYRGSHCPVCRSYLRQLDKEVGDFTERGVEVIAVSGDDREHAEKAATEWKLENLKIGYDMPVESMREWGLFVSDGLEDGEPEQFGEPGLFLIRPDGAVFYEGINSMPFGRPKTSEMRDAVDYVIENDAPPRGVA